MKPWMTALLLCLTSATQAAVPTAERDALVALYNATNGPGWTNNTNWLNGDPCENNWFGIGCDSTNTAVIGLILTSNGLSGALPAEIGDLSSLQTLRIYSNQITGLPAETGNLTNLQELHLANNQLSGLPATLGNLSSLLSLHLDNNQLTDLPVTIGNLSALQLLSLANNQLSELPNALTSLTGLTYLNINSNRVALLPTSLGNLANLQTLLLNDNQLGNLPASLWSLTALKRLELNGNQLSKLPPEIGNLTQLTSLSIAANRINSLPTELWSLTGLTKLYLSWNPLGSIASGIGNLTNLADLDLSHARLSALPPELWTLPSLYILQLNGNPLITLPAAIENLANLIVLNLSNCQLTDLPVEIGNLSALEDLYIADNQLTSLPATITNLGNIWSVLIDNNALYQPDAAITTWLNSHAPTGWQDTQLQPPVNLSATVSGNLQLTWNAPAGGLTPTGYTVMYGAQAGGPWPNVAGQTLEPDRQLAVAQNKQANAQNCFVVQSWWQRADGTRLYSVPGNEVCQTGNTLNAYSVGGNVTGLAKPVWLFLASQQLLLTQDGGFTFPDPLLDGSTYQVQLGPVDNYQQYCSLSNAGGTISGAPVQNVSLQCEANLGPESIRPLGPQIAYSGRAFDLDLGLFVYDPNTNDSLALSTTTTLPAWLTFGNLALSGTPRPADLGPHVFIMTLVDNGGRRLDLPVDIEVVDGTEIIFIGHME